MGAPKVILNRILVQHHAQGYALPILKPPFDSVGNALRQFFDWLANLFHFRILDDLKSLPFHVFTLVAYGLLIALAAVFIWVIYLALNKTNAKPPLVESRALQPSRLDEAETLLDLIRDSLSHGDFACAARWRWRLFLVRRKIPLSRTLVEVFPTCPDNIFHYSLMFRSDGSTGTRYEEFDRWVSVREASLE